jgi:hypothetical protein
MAKALVATSLSKKTGVACVPTLATTLRRHPSLVADRVPRNLPFQYTLVVESGVESNNRTLALLTPGKWFKHGDTRLALRRMSDSILHTASNVSENYAA